jgi:DNA-binding NarL/FixJ family response regulator
VTYEAIRVLIVDDNAGFRGGLRALLATVPDITVVGEAASGQQAAAMADRLSRTSS